jgi:mRNA-degrading endonuclease RelE of RelBE toxin-antitoxin system
MYRLEFTESARDDLDALRAYEQNRILDTIDRQLPSEPKRPTRQRKELRPNPLAAWELRVGEYRVFYDVDEEEQVVRIKAIGRKEHNRLTIRGKEFPL